jgi:hypothetical protein
VPGAAERVVVPGDADADADAAVGADDFEDDVKCGLWARQQRSMNTVGVDITYKVDGISLELACLDGRDRKNWIGVSVRNHIGVITLCGLPYQQWRSTTSRAPAETGVAIEQNPGVSTRDSESMGRHESW